jgi:beta-phosphoglucomutase-like phosphatase (HAD superfamily)
MKQDLKQEIEKLITPEKVLFFDMDGTLVDTNFANFLAYSNAIKAMSMSVKDLIYDPNRRFNRSTLKSTFPYLSSIEYDRIIQEKELRYDDLLYYTKLNNSVSEILLKYSKLNKTVLVTNCRTERAISTLNHHSLIEKFDHIFYRQFSENDEKINKYQFAISSLGINSNNVIIFENEDQEIIDAQDAGILIKNILKT